MYDSKIMNKSYAEVLKTAYIPKKLPREGIILVTCGAPKCGCNAYDRKLNVFYHHCNCGDVWVGDDCKRYHNGKCEKCEMYNTVLQSK